MFYCVVTYSQLSVTQHARLFRHFLQAGRTAPTVFAHRNTKGERREVKKSKKLTSKLAELFSPLNYAQGVRTNWNMPRIFYQILFLTLIW